MTAPEPRSFRTRGAFRTWLTRNHRSAAELLVRIYRVHAGERGLTYSDALDEALCFGWIDGVRRRLDADSFSIRFSPRRPRSIWSRINVAHVERLIREGRMTDRGMVAFAARTAGRTGVYAFEQRPVRLAAAFVRKFKAEAAAWRYFHSRPAWYRRTSTFWVMGAKREETRARRLGILIACSARKRPIPQLARESTGRN